MSKRPLLFEEFFELGLPDEASPFLKPAARKWGEQLELKSSFVAAGCLIIAFILSFFPHWLFLSHIFLLFVYFIAGIPSLINAVKDLMLLNINIDVLMTLAAFSSVFIGGAMEGGLLLVLFSLSGSMEDTVAMKAKGAISHLKPLSPKTALVVEEENNVVEKSVQDISVGDKLLVRAGEVIPLDGTILQGQSLVNLVHLTGEAAPVLKKEGDPVPAGATTTDGSFLLKVTHSNLDSTLSKIIQLVTEAERAKPALQRTFDKLSSGYAILIISLAALFAITLPFIVKLPLLGAEGSLYRALAFLIAASPCALIIAIPTAYLSAISSCAKNGIMLKGGIILDALAQCTQCAFDKTGTLTTGQLRVTHVNKEGDIPLNEALSIAYGLERGAKHPMAQAIIHYAQDMGVKMAAIEEFKVIPGYGLEGKYQGKHVYIGNPEYLISKLPEERAHKLEKEKDSIAILWVEGSMYTFHFEDELREGIPQLLKRLRDKNRIKLFMLTGDREASALKISKSLGFDEALYDLKPEDKLHHISRLNEQGSLIMVGDGINDAPAMARATVGIAMGKVGSGTALEAADIVLLQDNIHHLDWLLDKSKKTRRVVRQNLSLASIAIIIASIPALAGLVPLWLAVVLHEGGTVLVGLNALRLLKK